ncbi:D-xylose 1-dehydrogenase [Aureococcus anophagefferens]|nr:D-xylose 1-dehydrogenase [Aureococcus anophagefferens]
MDAAATRLKAAAVCAGVAGLFALASEVARRRRKPGALDAPTPLDVRLGLTTLADGRKPLRWAFLSCGRVAHDYANALNDRVAHVTQILEAGKHCVVEKPFACNLADGKKLVDLARRKRVFVMEGMWTRCFPPSRRRASSSAGAIGAVTAALSDFGFDAADSGSYPADPKDATSGDHLPQGHRRRGAALGGPYPIAAGFLPFGAKPKSVAAAGTLDPNTGVDLSSLARAAFYPADGPVATLDPYNFDAFVEAAPLTIVEFYAPWCGHCQQVAPGYLAAAALRTVLKPGLYRDDARNDGLVEELDAEGLASIAKGARDVNAVWVVEFYSDRCPHCKTLVPEMISAAEKLRKSLGKTQVRVAAINGVFFASDERGVAGLPWVTGWYDGQRLEDMAGLSDAQSVVRWGTRMHQTKWKRKAGSAEDDGVPGDGLTPGRPLLQALGKKSRRKRPARRRTAEIAAAAKLRPARERRGRQGGAPAPRPPGETTFAARASIARTNHASARALRPVSSAGGVRAKSSSSALMAARSGANSGVSQRKALAASPKMEVWSEKNIRFSLLAGIGLPIVGIVTPPDNVLFAATLPVAIAGVWIFIFLDLLKAAIPGDEDFDFDV